MFTSPKMPRRRSSPPLPLGLTVAPALRPLLTLAKLTTSTTSTRRSFLATFLSPSCILAAGTPTPLSELRRTGLELRRTIASEPFFFDSGHPRVRREPLNLFHHFPLAAGEPPRRNLAAIVRFFCLNRPGT
jgi:hypothetical protein